MARSLKKGPYVFDRLLKKVQKLNENGKKVLYMSYQTNEEIKKILDSFSYKELYRKEKIETSESAINSNDATTAFVLVKKIK